MSSLCRLIVLDPGVRPFLGLSSEASVEVKVAILAKKCPNIRCEGQFLMALQNIIQLLRIEIALEVVVAEAGHGCEEQVKNQRQQEHLQIL